MNGSIKLLPAGDKTRYVPRWYFVELTVRDVLNKACMISRQMNAGVHTAGHLVALNAQRETLREAMERCFDRLEAMGRPTAQEYYHQDIQPGISSNPDDHGRIITAEELRTMTKVDPITDIKTLRAADEILKALEGILKIKPEDDPSATGTMLS